MRGRVGVVLLVGLSVVAVACGDDDEPKATPTPTTSAASSPSTSVATTSTVPASTSTSTSTTSTPVDTSAGSTTVPDTEPATVAPTTATPIGGWEPIEFVPAVFPVGYSGNYEGTPSPAAPPDAAAPLADGYYHAVLREPWSPDDPGVLHLQVSGYAPCDQLGEVCYENPDAIELGVDPGWSRNVDFALDASTHVIVRGGRCGDEDEIGRGAGADLAELFVAYTDDYATVVAPLLPDGPDTIQSAIANGNSGGFRTEDQVCDTPAMMGPFRYVYADAPVLLIQSIARFNDEPPVPLAVDELVYLNGVDVRGGVITPYFYAGFSS